MKRKQLIKRLSAEVFSLSMVLALVVPGKAVHAETGKSERTWKDTTEAVQDSVTINKMTGCRQEVGKLSDAKSECVSMYAPSVALGDIDSGGADIYSDLSVCKLRIV